MSIAVNEAVKETQPLAGRTIVITRAAAQAAEFVSALEAFGAQVLLCPTIEITEPENHDLLDEAIEHLYGYDWIIFTSVNGVEYFFRRLVQCGHQVSELDKLHVCAIGEATACSGFANCVGSFEFLEPIQGVIESEESVVIR